jgi:hypothetical protein
VPTSDDPPTHTDGGGNGGRGGGGGNGGGGHGGGNHGGGDRGGGHHDGDNDPDHHHRDHRHDGRDDDRDHHRHHRRQDDATIYESNNQNNASNSAARNADECDRGYDDGLYTGANDARRGQSYDPQSSHFYKRAGGGIFSSGRSGAAQQDYRECFLRGYEEGFRNYQTHFSGGFFHR